MKIFKKIMVISLCCIYLILPFSVSAIGVRYTDYKTNLSFISPEGWSVKKEENGSALDRVMFSNDYFISGTDVIYYKSYDWYNTQLGTRKYITRDKMDNKYLTKEYIAEIYDVGADGVYKVTINDVEYYRFDTERLTNGQIIKSSLLMNLYNGYFFTFQLSTIGNIDNKDFSRMMESVDYSKVIENTESPINQFVKNSAFVLAIFVFILMVNLYMFVPLEMTDKNAKKHKKANKKTEIQNYYTQKRVTSSSDKTVCRKCGQRLTDEKICQNCGAKVRKW